MDDGPRYTLTDLCEDVLLMISDLLNLQCSDGEKPIRYLSMVNRRLRSILSPCLFKSLCINRPLSQLSCTPLIYRHAKTLKIDMFGSMWWWCAGAYVSSKDALDLFAAVKRMPQLKRLEVTMMKRNLDMFLTAFEEMDDAQTLLLPGVETLVVTSAAAFLASHCPDLKNLIVEDAPSCMIEPYVDVPTRLTPLHPQLVGGQWTYPQLTHFDTTASWSAAEIAALVPSFPRLQHLHMRSDAFCYRASIETIMELLGCSLGDLQTLKLNKVGHLDMGFRAVWKRSIATCTTQEQRRILWLHNEARRVEAENNVARLAFLKIQRLKEIWLGDKRVARRSAGCNGKVDLSWIWERRREAFDDCTRGSEWAKYREEKEAVVIHNEVCT
ncbi:uncharacterized protein EKO05_0010094 [Ascochyta rabiei]|uniref:Uncharacterized protein n=1 Tax=Didymella rabiei TaxID=5454 RepID=A0A163KLL2_DIDRA|nr:uncharacterized protein EKO05_0010094 [Ascochyta rabiei]KZM27085.1 hypothetical protein ST47_g1778 [Ascochyta rabiei]UPX19843.1 hypothetical protein EKO05_0010094 [Ascochyta rabiei]